MTTYDSMNPTFVIFKYNRTSYELLDYDAYWADLEEANKNPTEIPEFKKHYSASEAYGMKDLSIAEWDKLLDKISDGGEMY